MTERPILFSAPMVRAILEGRKTQTRRVVKPQPVEHDFGIGGVRHAFVSPQTMPGYLAIGTNVIGPGNTGYLKRLPYGKPGDRLWVRETWNYKHDLTAAEQEKRAEILGRFERGECRDIVADAMELPRGTGEKRAIYAADFGDWAYDPDSDLHWRPSIHMPRWASRITLEIASVRVERVQEISLDDARAEGIPEYGHQFRTGMTEDELDVWRNRSTVENFEALWDRINGKRPGCAWSDNPFVWVIEFSRCG